MSQNNVSGQFAAAITP